MTNWVSWFRYQLQASADGFAWAYEQVPPPQRDQLPPEPAYMGTWTPRRHLWHVAGYEEWIVIPSMQQWLGGDFPDGELWHDDDDAYVTAQSMGLENLVEHFCTIRQQQIALLDALGAVDWEAPRATLWGPQPLKMVVTKTYQHTFEHGDTLLRMALWWK
ncbi:MAG: DinB family protein [Caldilineaceae bacterium]